MAGLYKFQEAGVKFLLSGQNCLLADDMGLGKTIQTIEAINRCFAKTILIICPAAVKVNWARELVQWSRVKRNIHIVMNGKDPIPSKADVIIINYDLLIKKPVLKHLSDYVRIRGPWDFLVCDEAHYLKTLNAKRTKAVLGSLGIARMARRRVGLTGTPLLNRPKELYPLLRAWAPKNIDPYRDWYDFGMRFCGGPRHVGEFKGASNLGDLNKRLEGFMLRRKKEEVLDDLPDKIIQRFYVEPDYNLVRDDDPSNDYIEIFLPTERRLLGIAKINAAISHVKQLLTSDGFDKVVVFGHHREVLERVRMGLLNFNPVLFYGSMGVADKQKAIDSFVNDAQTRVFVGQFHAAGQGIDGLQKVCSVAVFVETDWTPGIMDQAIDRLRRIGQKNPVLVHYLMVAGSIDEQLHGSVNEKRRIIRRVLHQEMKDEDPLMSIESSLERIANALEALVTNGNLVSDSNPEPAKKSTSSKKKSNGDTTPEPTPNAAASGVATKEELEPVRRAASAFVNSSADGDGNKAKAKELFAKYGASQMADLKAADVDAVVQELDAMTQANKAAENDVSDL